MNSFDDYEIIGEYLSCFDCPVVLVTGNEVLDFVDELNDLSPLEFRLPSNYEWSIRKL